MYYSKKSSNLFSYFIFIYFSIIIIIIINIFTIKKKIIRKLIVNENYKYLELYYDKNLFFNYSYSLMNNVTNNNPHTYSIFELYNIFNNECNNEYNNECNNNNNIGNKRKYKKLNDVLYNVQGI